MNYNQFIGIPFLWGGRDPKVGLDCWGLVLEVLKYQKRSIDIDYDTYSQDDIHRIINTELNLNRWIEGPIQLGSLVLMGSNGKTKHIGVCLDSGVIHTTRRFGVVVDSVLALKRKGYRNIRFYRFALWDK